MLKQGQRLLEHRLEEGDGLFQSSLQPLFGDRHTQFLAGLDQVGQRRIGLTEKAERQNLEKEGARQFRTTCHKSARAGNGLCCLREEGVEFLRQRANVKQASVPEQV